MLLLFIYISMALGFSFLCSIAEAVLLSVTTGYIAMLEQEERPSGALLRELKEDINQPLAAILTLNTIAHTMGAAGAGAQAALVFGNTYMGIISAVLTLLILVFSEIIPKTLGAQYWQSLAPFIGYCLRFLIYLLYPFVKLSAYLTGSLTAGAGLTGFNRDEFAAMAELSGQDGSLVKQEARILKSLLTMHGVRVQDAMTPRAVIFSLPETMTVQEYYEQHRDQGFSRIPVYAEGEQNNITSYVLLKDLLLAQARGEGGEPVGAYKRDLQYANDKKPLLQAFDLMVQQQLQMLIVVDEYGGVLGLLTLEDVLETVLGLEIIDEGDKSMDMQELARQAWRKRAGEKGLDVTGLP